MELDKALQTLIKADKETIRKLEGPGKDLIHEIREEAAKP